MIRALGIALLTTSIFRAIQPRRQRQANHTTTDKTTHNEGQDPKAANDPALTLAPLSRTDQQNTGDAPSDLSRNHGNSHFSLEPNPFEQSFGNPSTDTPGKSLLPPVAALASPAIPGISASGGFNWANSLRSGPLSPAMLAGPAGNDYFDVTRGFPTPTESSLRTGLTPGGGGSMFPAPSPGTQALFQSLQANGTATPSTLDFHRTALNAAAARKGQGFNATTSAQDNDAMVQTSMDVKPANGPSDNYTQHDATDAANGLFMLAKGAQHANNQYPPPQQVNAQPQAHHGRMNSDANTRASLDSSVREHSGEVSDGGPKGKGRGKKGKAAQAANGKRKAEETTPAKNTKRSKAVANMDPSLEEDSEEEEDDMDGPDTKKMTDEEKRKNFLERNR